MTRAEHLKFCKKCLNRKFDPQQGIICQFTGKIADFEDECSDFSLDENVKDEQVSNEVKESNIELISKLPDDVRVKLIEHQDIVYAIVGGFFLSIISAILWATLTVLTQYQISYMAIGVGLIVGFGVRFFGAGIEQKFGIIGGLLAFLGCVLGNLFSQVGFIANMQGLGYIDTFLLTMNFETILLIYSESFSPIDLLFYGIAVYEGYKFAFREVPTLITNPENLKPAYSNLRLPLVIICFIIISFTGFKVSQGINGKQTFHYESGNIMSTGEFEDGMESGIWEYYYESGRLNSNGAYENGLEEGVWNFYYESGELMRKGSYQHGLPSGVWLNYYPSGILSDSSVYEGGRLHGPSKTYFENGNLAQEGMYDRDKKTGLWKIFYENGGISAVGSFKKDELNGNWKFYKQDGALAYDASHTSSEISINNCWDQNGNQTVNKGNGVFYTYYDNGTIAQKGSVTNGNKTGDWITYYPNGALKEKGKFIDNLYVLNSYWAPSGENLVKGGEGTYISYFDDTEQVYETGKIREGLKEGYWETYYSNSTVLQQELNYSKGKLNGRSAFYFQDGTLGSEGYFENDKKVGDWAWYYESGMIQCTATFKNDKKEGSQIFWSESGIEAKEELYENGNLISEQYL